MRNILESKDPAAFVQRLPKEHHQNSAGQGESPKTVSGSSAKMNFRNLSSTSLLSHLLEGCSSLDEGQTLPIDATILADHSNFSSTVWLQTQNTSSCFFCSMITNVVTKHQIKVMPHIFTHTWFQPIYTPFILINYIFYKYAYNSVILPAYLGNWSILILFNCLILFMLLKWKKNHE